MVGLNSKETFEAWLDQIASKKWVTHSGRRVRHLRGAESLIKYNSHYVSGMAISDCRIRLETNGQVTFTIKDYKNNEVRKTETVSGKEFVLRVVNEKHAERNRFKKSIEEKQGKRNSAA